MKDARGFALNLEGESATPEPCSFNNTWRWVLGTQFTDTPTVAATTHQSSETGSVDASELAQLGQCIFDQLGSSGTFPTNPTVEQPNFLARSGEVPETLSTVGQVNRCHHDGRSRSQTTTPQKTDSYPNIPHINLAVSQPHNMNLNLEASNMYYSDYSYSSWNKYQSFNPHYNRMGASINMQNCNYAFGSENINVGSNSMMNSPHNYTMTNEDPAFNFGQLSTTGQGFHDRAMASCMLASSNRNELNLSAVAHNISNSHGGSNRLYSYPYSRTVSRQSTVIPSTTQSPLTCVSNRNDNLISEQSQVHGSSISTSSSTKGKQLYSGKPRNKKGAKIDANRNLQNGKDSKTGKQFHSSGTKQNTDCSGDTQSLSPGSQLARLCSQTHFQYLPPSFSRLFTPHASAPASTQGQSLQDRFVSRNYLHPHQNETLQHNILPLASNNICHQGDLNVPHTLTPHQLSAVNHPPQGKQQNKSYSTNTRTALHSKAPGSQKGKQPPQNGKAKQDKGKSGKGKQKGQTKNKEIPAQSMSSQTGSDNTSQTATKKERKTSPRGSLQHSHNNDHVESSSVTGSLSTNTAVEASSSQSTRCKNPLRRLVLTQTPERLEVINPYLPPPFPSIRHTKNDRRRSLPQTNQQRASSTISSTSSSSNSIPSIDFSYSSESDQVFDLDPLDPGIPVPDPVQYTDHLDPLPTDRWTIECQSCRGRNSRTSTPMSDRQKNRNDAQNLCGFHGHRNNTIASNSILSSNTSSESQVLECVGGTTRSGSSFSISPISGSTESSVNLTNDGSDEVIILDSNGGSSINNSLRNSDINTRRFRASTSTDDGVHSSCSSNRSLNTTTDFILSGLELVELREAEREGRHTCLGCSRPVQDRYVLQVRDHGYWHADCLRCCTCDVNLSGQQSCYVRDDRVFCRSDYYVLYGLACVKCSLHFKKDEDWMRVAGQHRYHIACFLCKICKRQLGSNERYHLVNGTDIYCTNHYRDLVNGDNADGQQPPKKAKRNRTSYTEAQIKFLQDRFNIDSNPDGNELEKIASRIGLKKRVVQVWFQNNRARLKKNANNTKGSNQESKSQTATNGLAGPGNVTEDMAFDWDHSLDPSMDGSAYPQPATPPLHMMGTTSGPAHFLDPTYNMAASFGAGPIGVQTGCHAMLQGPPSGGDTGSSSNGCTPRHQLSPSQLCEIASSSHHCNRGTSPENVTGAEAPRTPTQQQQQQQYQQQQLQQNPTGNRQNETRFLSDSPTSLGGLGYSEHNGFPGAGGSINRPSVGSHLNHGHSNQHQQASHVLHHPHHHDPHHHHHQQHQHFLNMYSSMPTNSTNGNGFIPPYSAYSNGSHAFVGSRDSPLHHSNTGAGFNHDYRPLDVTTAASITTTNNNNGNGGSEFCGITGSGQCFNGQTPSAYTFTPVGRGYLNQGDGSPCD